MNGLITVGVFLVGVIVVGALVLIGCAVLYDRADRKRRRNTIEVTDRCYPQGGVRNVSNVPYDWERR
jgi:hypothetical protein